MDGGADGVVEVLRALRIRRLGVRLHVRGCRHGRHLRLRHIYTIWLIMRRVRRRGRVTVRVSGISVHAARLIGIGTLVIPIVGHGWAER